MTRTGHRASRRAGRTGPCLELPGLPTSGTRKEVGRASHSQPPGEQLHKGHRPRWAGSGKTTVIPSKGQGPAKSTWPHLACTPTGQATGRAQWRSGPETDRGSSSGRESRVPGTNHPQLQKGRCCWPGVPGFPGPGAVPPALVSQAPTRAGRGVAAACTTGSCLPWVKIQRAHFSPF